MNLTFQRVKKMWHLNGKKNKKQVKYRPRKRLIKIFFSSPLRHLLDNKVNDFSLNLNHVHIIFAFENDSTFASNFALGSFCLPYIKIIFYYQLNRFQNYLHSLYKTTFISLVFVSWCITLHFLIFPFQSYFPFLASLLLPKLFLVPHNELYQFYHLWLYYNTWVHHDLWF